MPNFDQNRNAQPSPKVSKLHRTVLESFNEADQAKFTAIFSEYGQNKNVQRLVEGLHQLCNTPQQREEIYPLVRSFIPQKHRERFDYECSRSQSTLGRHYATYSKRQVPKYGYHTTRSLRSHTRHPVSGSSLSFEHETPRNIDSRNRMRRSPERKTPSPKQSDYHTIPKSSRKRKESNVRVVVLEREVEGESFGFCIRGGSEYNIGLFVSSVDEASVAFSSGVCLGDQILEANRVDFRNISHQDAVEVIQQASVLHMLVKSVGKIPGSFKSSESYRWTDPCGNEVSPPPQYENMAHGDKSEMRLLGADDERKVNLFVADGAELGLKIRGGVEHGLGIFIASVEPNSGADRAGIQIGDQILDVNGKSFASISHAEAVRVLKSSQQLVIMLKDVGILPHGKRVYDETRWISHVETNNSPRPSSVSSSDIRSKSMKKTPSFHDPIGSSQLTHHSVLDHSDEILEIKARQLLRSDDQTAFAFYLNEYRLTRLSLTAFLAVLSDLLNTPEKGSLFHEIRSAILPRDLAKFDEWIRKTGYGRLQASETKPEKASLYSSKSSDSTNSWLGLFENGEEQRIKTNFEIRGQVDPLPHPPKDFLDESLNLQDSFDDLPPPPVVDLNTAKTGFENQTRKYAEKFTGSWMPSKHTGQPQQEDNRVSLCKPSHSAEKKSYTSRGRSENFGRNVVHVGKNCATEDEVYSRVDYQVPNRISGNLMDRTGKDGESTGNSSRTIEDELGIKDKDNTKTSMDSMQDTNATDYRFCTSMDHDYRSLLWDGATGNRDAKTHSQHNGLGFVEHDTPLRVPVDKSDIPPKETRNTLPEEGDFEIPQPKPDRLYLEFEQNTDFEKSPEISGINNTGGKRQSPKHTDFIARQLTVGSQSDNATDARPGTKFSESLQTCTEKSSTTKNNAVVQKRNKGKKSRIKPTLVQAEKNVDYCQPFVVELTKHSSNLGLSVAGGTDTDSKEIRIKSIKDEDTVAGSCPLLQPGQIILGVDEKSLQNVTSGIAAMAIRQAFHSDKTILKLILQNDG